MTKFKKLTKIILPVLFIVFLAVSCNRNSVSPTSPTSEERQQIQVVQRVEGAMSDELFNFYADENKTAMDLLKMKHGVEVKTFSGVGEYVTSIDGKKEDTGKNFWALYVNGAQSQVGASEYKPKDKDNIVWKLEEIK